MEFMLFFEDLASTYKELLFSGAVNNRIKTYMFAEILFKSFGSMQDDVSHEELYFKMAEKYFGKGETPLSTSPKNLPEIRPPSRLGSSTTIPSFSSLYREFSDTHAKWMLTSFFIMQLFQESVERSESFKLVITNALEELLFNCSAKVLKSGKDLLVFEQMQVFIDAFLSVINNDINQNHSDFSREHKTYKRNIRIVFVSKETDGRLEDLKNKERTQEINSELLESLDDLGGSRKNAEIVA